MEGHPMLKKHNWKRRCIALLLHADAAGFQPTDSLMTVSFRGLLMSKPGMEEPLYLGMELESPPKKNKWPDTDPLDRNSSPPEPLFPCVGKEIPPNNYFAVLFGFWVAWTFSKMAWA